MVRHRVCPQLILKTALAHERIVDKEPTIFDEIGLIAKAQTIVFNSKLPKRAKRKIKDVVRLAAVDRQTMPDGSTRLSLRRSKAQECYVIVHDSFQAKLKATKRRWGIK